MNGNHFDPSERELEEAQLTAYALGQLGPEERAAVEARLAHSERARQLVEETTSLAEEVCAAHRQGPSPQPSEGLREAVEHRLSQWEDSQMTTTRDRSPARNRRIWGLVALAACLAIMATALLLPRLGDVREAASRSKKTPSPSYLSDDSSYTAEELYAEGEKGLRAKEKRLVQIGFAIKTAGEVSEKSQPSPTAEPWASTPERPGPGKLAPVGLDGQPAREGQSQSGGQGSLQRGDGRLPRPSNATLYIDVSGRPAAQPSGSVSEVMAPGLDPSTRQPQPAGKPMQYAPAAVTTPLSTLQPEVSVQKNPGRFLIASKDSVRLVLSGRRLERHSQIRVDQLTESEEGRHGYNLIAGSGEAPGTEQYDPIVENAFIEATGEAAVSTFSVDVDTASYANVRRFLNHGRLPPPDAVRIEEMVNYFKYDYPLPEGDVPFSANMEVAQCPWNAKHRLLRIGLKGQEIDINERGPSHLVFLLDVSGSMQSGDKLPLVKQAMAMLTEQLGEDDRVAIVTYASGTGVKLTSTGGHEPEKILTAIESLSAGGSTHGSAGIQLAYDQAVEHFVEGGTNRVILCTDGDLNVGITDDDELVKLITQQAKSGVFLTVLGFGTGNLKDSKMEKLADKGNGIYAYIDSAREARKVLVEQLSGSLVTIAKDVKVQVIFNPAEVHSYRLIGYENRMLATKDFTDDKKDAGEIGAGHTVTALYEIVPAVLPGEEGKEAAADAGPDLKYQKVPKYSLTKAARSGELLTLKLRYKLPEAAVSTELEFTIKDEGKRFSEASADFRFASAVAAFGMVLRGSQHSGELTLSAVEEFAAGACFAAGEGGEDAGEYRRQFVELVRRAKGLLPK